jgi:hypothetical protein
VHPPFDHEDDRTRHAPGHLVGFGRAASAAAVIASIRRSKPAGPPASAIIDSAASTETAGGRLG